jgi:hypothetical protein
MVIPIVSYQVEKAEDGSKVKYHYEKYASPKLGKKGYHVRVSSMEGGDEEATSKSNDNQAEWDGTNGGLKNLRGGN